jgi:hypothetical protein
MQAVATAMNLDERHSNTSGSCIAAAIVLTEEREGGMVSGSQPKEALGSLIVGSQLIRTGFFIELISFQVIEALHSRYDSHCLGFVGIWS